MRDVAGRLGSRFQSPMGIGITSNEKPPLQMTLVAGFQSPMGIGITSNDLCGNIVCAKSDVSIPNGDRHYLEPGCPSFPSVLDSGFQSPMGIGITSNWVFRSKDCW